MMQIRVLTLVGCLTVLGGFEHSAWCWEIEAVDTAGSVGAYSSIALNNEGLPHISYFDESNRSLKYARREGTGWNIETVDSLGTVGWFSSLKLDAAGNPVISCYEALRGDLRIARRGVNSWILEAPDTAGFVGLFSSLAIGPGGYPHVSYWDSSRQDLKYAYRSEAGWQIETVDSVGSVGKWSSLALDWQGVPHIAYYDGSRGDLKLAIRDGAGWQVSVLDSEANTGLYASAAVLGSSTHVSYFKAAPHFDLVFNGLPVDTAGDVGWWTSLALGPGGLPCISYYDHGNRDLKFAWRRSALDWRTEIVDTSGAAGQYTSLAIDAAGHPHISYYDPSPNFDLRYAYGPPVGLEETTSPESPRLPQLALSVYPNPFSSSVRIRARYIGSDLHGGLAERSRLPSSAVLYNLLGQRVEILAAAEMKEGGREFTWDGWGGDGRRASSGIYLCRLLGGQSEVMLKLVLRRP